jgi:hypothetical protein
MWSLWVVSDGYFFEGRVRLSLFFRFAYCFLSALGVRQHLLGHLSNAIDRSSFSDLPLWLLFFLCASNCLFFVRIGLTPLSSALLLLLLLTLVVSYYTVAPARVILWTWLFSALARIPNRDSISDI